VDADVRDLEAIQRVVRDVQPVVVFHLAAQSLVRRSYEAPVETYATNVMGTVHVLEAIRRVNSVRVLVNVTSDKCYENQDWEWGYRESDPKGGRDPYSSSKACAELVTAAYRLSFLDSRGSPAVASARAGNVIGGGDWAADRLVPDLMRAAHSRIPVPVRSPRAVRAWQHVLNPLSGYLVLAEHLWNGPEFADGWNFGPADTDARPVAWVVERIAALWGTELRWEIDPSEQPHEAHALKVDSARARERLGWTPGWGIDRALSETVKWYRADRDGTDMRAFTLGQIQAYQASTSDVLSAA
jgi:CDP-glucose 4,6-dehydratase